MRVSPPHMRRMGHKGQVARRPAPCPASGPRRTVSAGFTLVELLTVMGLFGVGLAIVVPPMATLLQRTATQVAADRFIATHGLARATAVRFGRVAELHIDGPNGRYWIQVDTSEAGQAPDTLGAVRHVLPEGLLTTTSDRAVVCFDSRGLPTNRGACEAADVTVVFSQDARADTVKISITGRVLR